MLPLKTSYPTLVGFSARELRESKEIPQRLAAQSLGISSPALSRIESGDTPLSSEHACNIAFLYKAKPSDIFLRADEVGQSLAESDWAIEPRRVSTNETDLLKAGLSTGLTLPKDALDRLLRCLNSGALVAVLSRSLLPVALGPVGWITSAILVGSAVLTYQNTKKSRSKAREESVFSIALAGAEALRKMDQ